MLGQIGERIRQPENLEIVVDWFAGEEIQLEGFLRCCREIPGSVRRSVWRVRRPRESEAARILEERAVECARARDNRPARPRVPVRR